jgi:hypothetical protein
MQDFTVTLYERRIFFNILVARLVETNYGKVKNVQFQLKLGRARTDLFSNRLQKGKKRRQDLLTIFAARLE